MYVSLKRWQFPAFQQKISNYLRALTDSDSDSYANSDADYSDYGRNHDQGRRKIGPLKNVA